MLREPPDSGVMTNISVGSSRLSTGRYGSVAVILPSNPDVAGIALNPDIHTISDGLRSQTLVQVLIALRGLSVQNFIGLSKVLLWAATNF